MDATNAIMEEYWSRFSESYDENQEYVVGQFLLNEVKENINNLTELGEVLELGCGTGYFTEAISKKAKHVFATDLSDDLLNKVGKRIKNLENVSIQKENCEETSFSSNKFDSVFIANLIHVVESPMKVIHECSRLLKDDGQLIITTFTNYGMNPFEKIKMGIRFVKVWGKPPKFAHRFTPESLKSILETNGYSVLESKLLGNKTKSLFLIAQKLNNKGSQ